NRHAAFRSTFEWEDRPQPGQVEQAQVRLPWEEHDLRGLTPEERGGRIGAFLAADRKRGFDFRTPPLTRATLFRMAEDAWTFVWTFHHILADGSSYPALIREGFALYAALRDGKELTLPAPRPHREFIQWLGTHLATAQPRAEAYWRQTLRGFAAPILLPGLA